MRVRAGELGSVGRRGACLVVLKTMHVWRFPLSSFAALVTGTGVATLFVLLSLLRPRRQVLIGRLGLLACGAAGLLSSPFVIKLIAHDELSFLARHGVWTKWTAPVYWIPGASALILLMLALRLFPHNDPGYSAKWRFALLGLCFAFAFLNLANWCSPGWCARFGFPFSYSWWSDAIVIFNGENLSAGISILAGLGNAMVLGFAIAALARKYRKGTLRSA